MAGAAHSRAMNLLRISFFAAVLWAPLALEADLPAGQRMNVLLICVDDLKPLLGCYGSDTIKSPSIDRLAQRGIVFERAYCNQAVCAPSRNALMTGLRPTTLGIYDLPTFFRKAKPDAVTLGQAFQKAGYRVEALGKIYHVGHGNQNDAASWSVPHWTPKKPMYVLESNLPPAETGLAAKKKKGKQGTRPADRGASWECADVPDSTYGDGAIADEAIARLRTAGKRKGEPFFLAVGFMKPHLPFVAPKKYWDLYKTENFVPAKIQEPPKDAPEFAPTTWGELRNYSDIPSLGKLSREQQQILIHGYHAAVSYMDAQVGRVLKELEALGLDKNTIVVLWGDHGWHLGDHGMWCKHTNYEEAARIPLLVSAPGTGRPGSKTKALVETVDIYPSLCELAGLPAPAETDGTSFVPLLKNPGSAGKQAVFHAYPRAFQGKQMIGRAVRTQRYRMVEWKVPGASDAIFELYDYEADPDETQNLAATQKEVLAELRALLGRQPEAKPKWKEPAA
jgi:iduronate 2-sulfatase